jgi:general stress protein 26
MSALSQLTPGLVAMMARGVSVHVGSCDAQSRPSVMRAMASHIDDARGAVTVYLARRQATQLLADIEATGRIAVMFSEPSTHVTVQLKATRATCRDATQHDQPRLDAYLASMEIEIQRVGHPARVTRAMLACALDDIVAVEFEPEQVFEQTPGPKAGKLMAGGR